MEQITINLGYLTSSDREAIQNRADHEGRDVEAVLLDLIKAGLHGSVHNVQTGNVSGPSIQAGHIRGDMHL
ncbi:hypothetical protein [Saccharopolyspora sp. 6V]|uniref:hypothetical protein n=1 Tax=Saccharopolyspora sp. 6V TaxID=2877239 RepID=UPI001CD7E602|nr:hypothetical protein [Saccharopolyspora sp. 6V]MCA1191632.1 hypothetical protein [Saccharopolyspora sp. 6V]